MSRNGESDETGPRIAPAGFTPPEGRGRPTARLRWLAYGGAGLLTILAGVTLWFVFTAHSVAVEVTPVPSDLAIRGGLVVPVGDRYLARPGRYRVHAERPGYHALDEKIVVGTDRDVFRFELVKLPGRLTVITQPEGARMEIDGEAVGRTPIKGHKLSPGTHELVARAERHRVARETVEIEGMNREQSVTIELTPAWAEVRFASEPHDAEVAVDGEVLGRTPLTAEIGAGRRDVAVSADGYQTWRRTIQVEPGEPMTLDDIALERARARLRVRSRPSGARILVAGEPAGTTPATVSVPPEREIAVRVAKPGHAPVERRVRLTADARDELAVTLEPILGEVRVEATPSGAELYVDGESVGEASQTLRLPAAPHVLEVRKEGYATARREITPSPNATRRWEVRLLTEAEARLRQFDDTITTALNQRLRLIAPGRFTMGAPRRQQGRRSNEVQRDVVLTRPFYIGVHEVTNAEFRAFRAGHSSGIVGSRTLDNDEQPVVRVSWDDAARFCNWLSKRDGLPPAYRQSGGGMALIRPVTSGYRLPTEAEWAWAARFAEGRDLKYPWGDSMPPPDGAGNFADVSVAGLVSAHLPDYDDGYAASAPVGRFAASALGLHDIGGNVAEWVHDRYATGLKTAGTTLRDPLGPKDGSNRVVRGSSWRDGSITTLRLSYRDNADDGRDDLGFRLARYAE